MTQPVDIQIPPIIAGRYRTVRELGRGGMGVVYIVEHVHTGDQLALKLLFGQAARDPQSIERFKREARASAKIKSEHVVKVVDADVAPELDGAPFLVMELLNGNDLEKQLETRGRFPPEEAMHYLAEAARALDKSHGIGIVHRDLKPENLFLHRREDGSTVLKILDFGISKSIGANDIGSAGMTSTGSVMGTPLFMSPEQARGRISEIGPATDIWAMGLIGLQLLTGECYWRANTLAELMVAIIAEPLYPPSTRWPWITPAVDQWFARACAREPKARFATVGEEVDALGVALGLRTGAAPGPMPANAYGAPPPMGQSPSLPQIPGAHTTNTATAVDGAPPKKAPVGAIVGAAVVGLCIAGGIGFFAVHSKSAATGDTTAAPSASTATATPAPSSTAAAPPSTGAAATAADAARTTATAPTTPPPATDPGAATHHPDHGGATHPGHTTSAPTHTAPTPTPTPAPKSGGGRFDPTMP